jgi:hypothetical protein
MSTQIVLINWFGRLDCPGHFLDKLVLVLLKSAVVLGG